MQSGYNACGGDAVEGPGGVGPRDVTVNPDLLAPLALSDPYERDAAQAELADLQK